MDLNTAFSLQDSSAAATAFGIGVFCPANATSRAQCGAGVEILVGSTQPDGSRKVTAAFPTPGVFQLLKGETSLNVRVLVDRSVVEVFVGGGRAVYTFRTYPLAGEHGVLLSNEKQGVPVVQEISAFEMGCGWEKQ
jgi:sucrose-6-phosphate hydrolase SacC (GH32 family)